ncbi:MAG: hypothetical protein RLZZ142_790 [Verrucomicrobiota bacterium]
MRSSMAPFLSAAPHAEVRRLNRPTRRGSAGAFSCIPWRGHQPRPITEYVPVDQFDAETQEEPPKPTQESAELKGGGPPDPGR